MAKGTGILALLAGPKGKGGSAPSSPMGDAGGGGDDAELGGALREMFDALKAGDDAGAALAFRRAKDACDDEGMEDEEEGDDMALPDDGMEE